MNRRSVIIIFLCCFTTILWIVKEEMKQNLDEGNFTVYTLEQQSKELDTQNMVLQEQLLPKQSLTVIASEAAQMGFKAK